MNKDDKRLFVTLTIVLSVLVVLLSGYLIYDKIIDKEEKNDVVSNEEDKEHNIIKYSIVETPVIGSLTNSAQYGSVEIADSNGNIKLSYPEIKYDSEEIKNLNNTIKTKVNNNIKELNDYEGVGDVPGCLTIKMNNSNNDITFDHFVYVTYKLIESSNYISILEIKHADTTCASGGLSISEVYMIDKNSKQLITQEELKENNNKIISELTKFLDNVEDESNSKHLKNELEQKRYFVYYGENNTVVVAIKNLTGSHYEKFVYDGTGFSIN